jgi:Putative restriction endonuclease
MAQSVKRKLGYDDLAGMPDDGLIREILDGLLFVTPSPVPMHQRVAKCLARQLEQYFEVRGLGEVFQAPLDVILGPHDVAEPDLVLVTDPALVTERAIEGAPARRRDPVAVNSQPGSDHQASPLRCHRHRGVLDCRDRPSANRMFDADRGGVLAICRS